MPSIDLFVPKFPRAWLLYYWSPLCEEIYILILRWKLRKFEKHRLLTAEDNVQQRPWDLKGGLDVMVWSQPRTFGWDQRKESLNTTDIDRARTDTAQVPTGGSQGQGSGFGTHWEIRLYSQLELIDKHAKIHRVIGLQGKETFWNVCKELQITYLLFSFFSSYSGIVKREIWTTTNHSQICRPVVSVLASLLQQAASGESSLQCYHQQGASKADALNTHLKFP